MEESSETSRPAAKGDAEPDREKEKERVEHFDDIVEWARSNGWTDFDFEGLERRVVELAKVMRQNSTGTASAPMKGSGKLIRFAKKLPTRKSNDV